MDSYENGIAQLKTMLGKQKAESIVKTFHDLSPTFENEAISVVFGRTWSRRQIDLKTRSLCSICILTALGRVNSLRIKFALALENGATKDEVVEVLLQVAIYAGYPAALDALSMLQEVLSETAE